MTHATDAGLVIGKKYKLKPDSDYYAEYNKDMLFTFTDDDHSTCVRFDCPTEYDRDGWCYIGIADVMEATAEDTATVVTFDVTVDGASTTINIGKPLTASQVAAVLVAAGL